MNDFLGLGKGIRCGFEGRRDGGMMIMQAEEIVARSFGRISLEMRWEMHRPT